MTYDTAFVLGGGGRWGAVEVGMLQALGIETDSFGGNTGVLDGFFA